MNNLVWFRNDLRIADNVSLKKACDNSGKTIGVYCIDPRMFSETKYGFKKTEKFRTKFLLETLSELRSNLLQNNISLFIYFDKPENVLSKMVIDHDISKIFVQKEFTSEETKIENRIKHNLHNVVWTETFDQFLFHPDDIPYKDFKSIPKVFTEFRKQCEKTTAIRTCVSIFAKPETNLVPNPTSVPLVENLGFDAFETSDKSAFPFNGGEKQALKRIDNYFFDTENVASYKQTRNGLIGESYSSKFSPWLANGSISARTIYWQLQEFEEQVIKNEDTYWLVFELIWRDFFKYIALKHGNDIFKIDGILNDRYIWKNNEKAFRDWTNGNTREPFVNANMVELQQTGFMSNRGRQNVASFWAKEWEQDWRVGAAYFESMLIDYDVHSNWGNWIYNAGVGNDPRDRKFNIKRQAEMYDSKGEYVGLWLK